MKIVSIKTEDYPALEIQVLRIEASPAVVAQVLEFVAKLNVEIHTPKNDTDDKAE